MSELPLLFAFSAGMAASVNPCGAIMLPALVAFLLGDPGAKGAPRVPLLRAARGLLVGLATAAGFVVIFAAVGLVLSLGGRALVAAFPFTGLAVGAGLALLGVWMLLAGGSLHVLPLQRLSVPLRPGVGGAFVFGIAYGACSLGCTLPIFLIVVGQALAAQGLAGAVVQFVVYALGMGLVLLLVSLATVLSQDTVQRWANALLPLVQRVGALLLIAAGGYLVTYWWPYLGVIR
ncbi:MAG: cytochrome c biogenesis protein CcdA [Chloroflexi bacterium]|nr:cytochrome c biogenesis protein CcdA [Chloroflexota bacterium]